MTIYVGKIEEEEFVVDTNIIDQLGVIRIHDSEFKIWCSRCRMTSKLQLVPIIGGAPDFNQVLYVTHVFRDKESLNLFELIKSPLGIDLSKVLFHVMRQYTRHLTISGFLYGWPSDDNYAPERIDYVDFGVVNPELRSLLLME